MSRLLASKVIAITGSSSGIGRATAIECARHGAKLVLHHIGDSQSKQDIQTLRDEISSVYPGLDDLGKPQVTDVAADIRDPKAGQLIVEAAISCSGEINGIVHNAGICQFLDFETVTAEQRDCHMAINFSGPFAITQAVVEQMKRQGTGGSVVSMASITATMGSSQLTHYAPTKAALLGMTVSCAVALGKYGIRFNAVSPGTTETAMNKSDLQGPKRAAMEARVPLRRLGMPNDIARVAVFFLSDMAGYVSGQNLIVDGGASVNYQ